MKNTIGLEEVLESTNGLMNSIISRYKNYYEYDDLYQVAAIGVMKAYKKYNKDKNVKFQTYAYTYILGEILKYVNDSKPFRISQDYRKLAKKIEEAKTVLTQKLMRVPNNKDLEDFIGLPETLIEEVTAVNIKCESLDKIICEDGKTLSLLDTISGKNNIPTEDEIMLHDALEGLDDKERKVIEFTYFKDYTQEKVSEKTGMTQVQISRKLVKTKNKLRNIMQAA